MRKFNKKRIIKKRLQSRQDRILTLANAISICRILLAIPLLIYLDDSNEIILGYSLARSLNIDVGSKIKLTVPKSDNTIFGNIPRFKTLIVSGIFDLGMYEYDSNFVFLSANISRKLLLLKEGSFTQIEIETENPTNVEDSQKIINNY